MTTSKASISLPTGLYNRAQAHWKPAGFTSFSDYIQYLLRRDIVESKGSTVQEEPATFASHRADIPEQTLAAIQDLVATIKASPALQPRTTYAAKARKATNKPAKKSPAAKFNELAQKHGATIRATEK